MAAAIRYARSRWDALTRYVDDRRLEISNNAAERAIRPISINRIENLLHWNIRMAELKAAA